MKSRLIIGSPAAMRLEPNPPSPYDLDDPADYEDAEMGSDEAELDRALQAQAEREANDL